MANNPKPADLKEPAQQTTTDAEQIRFNDVEDERTTTTDADLPEGMDEADLKEKENAPG